VDYQASIAQRTAAAPTGTPGAFRGGATTGTSYSDFDQSYNPINSYEQGSNGSGYLIRKGDTLAGIAAGLYGDSSALRAFFNWNWSPGSIPALTRTVCEGYKIAEVNGLSGQSALIEGQSLTLPAGVTRNTNNAATFQPYGLVTLLFRCGEI
jgi:hypothetical protein